MESFLARLIENKFYENSMANLNVRYKISKNVNIMSRVKRTSTNREFNF